MSSPQQNKPKKKGSEANKIIWVFLIAITLIVIFFGFVASSNKFEMEGVAFLGSIGSELEALSNDSCGC